MKTVANITIIMCALLLFSAAGFAQKQGIDAIDSLKKDMQAYSQPDTNKVRLIFRVTNAYTQVAPDSAMAYAQKGLALAKKLNWPKGIAGFYNAIGMLYSDNSDYAKALVYYYEALKLHEALHNKRNMASTLNNIGAAYQRQGNFVRSQKYNFRALKLAEEVKDDKLIAAINNNIAKIFSAQKDYKTALTYHLKALKTYQRMHNDGGLATVYNNIGNDYHEQGKTIEARNYYDKSLTLYRQTGNRIGEATVLSQIGLLYENDLDKKLDYLLQAQQLFDATDPNYSISMTNLGNIGGTYADIYINAKLKLGGNYKNIPDSYDAVAKKAESYLNRVILFCRAAGDQDNLSYFTANLAQLQEKEGNYKNALQNYKLSRSIDDSLYSQESKNKLAELAAQYTFQKKEDAFIQQRQISQLKMQQVYLYAILSVLLVGGILIYFLNRARIGQLRLKNELQRKEAEEQTRELLHKNKLSESELKAIRSQMNPHFIFNVLNSIESYILDNDPQMACRLVQKFATLSRIILENSTQSMVTADREWKALQLYTELEAIRFNHQFTYSFHADPLIDLTVLLLPPMLIQPLIENSIHHGLRNSTDDDKRLSITLEQTDKQLLFAVEDNGVGYNEHAKPKTTPIKGKSIGLSAIRERINIINALDETGQQLAAFEISSLKPPAGKGTLARLKLPKIFRREQ